MGHGPAPSFPLLGPAPNQVERVWTPAASPALRGLVLLVAYPRWLGDFGGQSPEQAYQSVPWLNLMTGLVSSACAFWYHGQGMAQLQRV